MTLMAPWEGIIWVFKSLLDANFKPQIQQSAILPSVKDYGSYENGVEQCYIYAESQHLRVSGFVYDVRLAVDIALTKCEIITSII